MKKKTIVLMMICLTAVFLTACGKSEFGLTENTGKRMIITAENASKDAFFMLGTLEVGDNEQIVISSDLKKGTVRVEISTAPENETADDPPAAEGEAILTANLKADEKASADMVAGKYMLKAICLEKATGTVSVEVLPAS